MNYIETKAQLTERLASIFGTPNQSEDNIRDAILSVFANRPYIDAATFQQILNNFLIEKNVSLDLIESVNSSILAIEAEQYRLEIKDYIRRFVAFKVEAILDKASDRPEHYPREIDAFLAESYTDMIITVYLRGKIYIDEGAITQAQLIEYMTAGLNVYGLNSTAVGILDVLSSASVI